MKQRFRRVARARYLLAHEQRDRRNAVGVLVALRDRDLLQELHLLLTGQKHDLGVAEHHDGVGELVSEQPRLRTESMNTHISMISEELYLHTPGFSAPEGLWI